jgi:ABC-type transport system involved in multi-copper enzyme maturation permease subunit
MTALLAAELLKLRTVRSTWGYALAVLALAALVSAGTIGAESAVRRAESDFQNDLLLDGAGPATIVALLLGIIVVTSEFRHGTITPSLLVTPRRDRLLGAKLLAGGAAGATLIVIALVVIAAIAGIWLGILGVTLEPGVAGEAAGRALVAGLLAGVLGAAVGGVAHAQVGALVGALVWIFVAEPLTWVLLGLLDLEGAADYAPAAALFSIAGTEEDGLSFAGAAGMTLVWIGVAASLALLRTSRRDIT